MARKREEQAKGGVSHGKCDAHTVLGIFGEFLGTGPAKVGIHVVIANEIMPDFAATLAANHPDTNVINKGIQARSAA